MAHRDFASHIPPLYLPRPKDEPPQIKESHAQLGESLPQRIQRVQNQFTAAQLLCLRMEFNAFDVDSSNTIDREELRAIVDSLGGHHVTDDELVGLMDSIDEDKSGEVDWIEYLNMMLLVAGCALLGWTVTTPSGSAVHTNKRADVNMLPA